MRQHLAHHHPWGGLGMMGEGTAGFGLNSFSNPLQVAITVITMAAMAAIGCFYKMPVNAKIVPASSFADESLPLDVLLYFSFLRCGLRDCLCRAAASSDPNYFAVMEMTILIMMVCKVSMQETHRRDNPSSDHRHDRRFHHGRRLTGGWRV